MRGVDQAGHLSREVLKDFFREGAPDHSGWVVGHLLSGCDECRSRAAEHFPAASRNMDEQVSSRFSVQERANKPEPLTGSHSPIGRRLRAAGDEIEAAEKTLSGVLGLPATERLSLLEENQERHSWGLVTVLLRSSRSEVYSDAGSAVSLAELAVLVAEGLDPEKGGLERASDLRALAHAELGNALRVQSNYRLAGESFARAKSSLEKGTRDPITKARVRVLQASYLGDLRRFDEAFQLFDRVIRTARRFSDRTLEGYALVAKALQTSYAGKQMECISLLREGVEYIDPAVEPRLAIVASHNLVLALTEQGHFQEAADRIAGLRHIHSHVSYPLDLLRLRWLEAKIASGLGRVEEALSELASVRARFIQDGVGLDAALVSLDLAAIYFRQGRMGEVGRLAAEMLPIFRSRDIHREATAALIFFQKAVEVEKVNLGLLAELGEYLERARNNPELRFRSEE